MASLMPLMSSRNPNALSTKALKTMGLSVQDLFESFMGPRSGQLSRQEFSIFWSAIGNADGRDMKDTLAVLKLFIKYFIDVSTDSSKKLPDFSLQSALNTIVFICLHLPVKPDTVLQKLVSTWAPLVDSLRKDAPLVSYGEAVAIVKAHLVDDADAFGLLVTNLHRMQTKETLKAINQDYIATLHRQDFVCPSFAFSYSVLLAQCRDKNRRLRIFDAVLTELANVRAGPSSVDRQQSVLALLHLLRSVLSYWRAPTGPFLQTALDRIGPFYSWPIPYSLVARRVLQMLKQEMLAPGNSVLERFAAESRVPETSQCPTNGVVSRSRPVFYVVDSSCPLSSNFCLLIGLHDADAYIDGESNMFASGLSTEVQALLLLNILHSPSAPIDPNDIYKVTEQDVTVLFGQTVNVLQESLDISPEDAISHRERNFALIRSQFTKIARANEARGVPSDLALPSVLPPTLMPPLPEIAHVHWLVTRDYVLPSSEAIAQLGFTPFPKTPLIDKLEKVMRLYEAFADAQDPVEVRLCIAGSDAVIHQVATAYLELMKRDTDPLKGITIRFFLVPFRNNILSAYIARFDSWYNRQLYVPFTTRTYLVPSMAEEEPVFNDARCDDPPTPLGQMLQANIESYVREAEYSLPVKLFQIEGWRRAPADDGPPDVVVPLVQRAEIGRVAAAMLFRSTVREGTMSALRDLKDIFRDKDFAYVPLELNVEMVRVDLMGNGHADDRRKQSVVREEPIPFDRISISNVPSADDPAHPPNPKDPWLEMFAKVSEQKSKLKNRYGFLIQEPLQHVSYLKLSTARDEQSFRVVVDGESFGPFKQVRISKIEDHTQKQASLNIATFFPINP